jgi:hypothetical protein
MMLKIIHKLKRKNGMVEGVGLVFLVGEVLEDKQSII